MGQLSPFTLDLHRFSSFVSSKDAVLFLDVNVPELAKLHGEIARHYPVSEKHAHREFCGHLTVGEMKGSKASMQQKADARCQELQRHWRPSEFLVDHLIVLLASSSEAPFQEYKRIPLG